MWMTPEELPLRSYRWIPALVSIPFGFLLELAYALLRITRRKCETIYEAPVPSNAIMVCLHPEFPLFMVDPQSWDDVISQAEDGAFYLGSHDFLSYAPSLVMSFLRGWKCFRYNRRLPVRPFDQLKDYLDAHPKRLMALRTDSGGPYMKVRQSVIDFAIRQDRPIICFRQKADRFFVFNQHYIPLPFTSIRTYISKPIPVETLKALPKEKALALVQDAIDKLGKLDDMPVDRP